MIPAARDACRGGNLIAVPSATFGASTVKPAEIDLLWRTQCLRLERADDRACAASSA
jgi:hypothetical protein